MLVLTARRNLLALAWYDAPRPGHLLEVLRVVTDIHRTHGSHGLLDVVVRGTPRFPEEVRAEGGRLVRETAPWNGPTAHVIEVEGFAGTATRMFLSTMLLLGRGRTALTRVYGAPREACAWLAPALSRPGCEWTEGELEGVYRALKSIEPRAAR